MAGLAEMGSHFEGDVDGPREDGSERLVVTGSGGGHGGASAGHTARKAECAKMLPNGAEAGFWPL